MCGLERLVMSSMAAVSEARIQTGTGRMKKRRNLKWGKRMAKAKKMLV